MLYCFLRCKHTSGQAGRQQFRSLNQELNVNANKSTSAADMLLGASEGKSPIFTLELSQKSDFQPSTTKPNNMDRPTVKTGQIWHFGWF